MPRDPKVQFTAPQEMIDEVNRIAAKRKMPKAQVYKMMLDLGIGIHQDMEKVGLIGVIDFTHFASKAVKDKLATLKNKQLNLI